MTQDNSKEIHRLRKAARTIVFKPLIAAIALGLFSSVVFAADQPADKQSLHDQTGHMEADWNKNQTQGGVDFEDFADALEKKRQQLLRDLTPQEIDYYAQSGGQELIQKVGRDRCEQGRGQGSDKLSPEERERLSSMSKEEREEFRKLRKVAQNGQREQCGSREEQIRQLMDRLTPEQRKRLENATPKERERFLRKHLNQTPDP
jgi:hypothetical protein